MHLRSLATCCALALFVNPSWGQKLFEAPYHAVQGEAKRVRYDWATRSWDLVRPKRERRDPDAVTPMRGLESARSRSLVKCFSNTVTNGFFTTPTTGREWIDWAVKKPRNFGGKSGVVGRFAFRYGTNARGLSESAGRGASVGISFYSGTTGFCSRGTIRPNPGNPPFFLGSERIFPPDEARFAFTGLPAATGSQVRVMYTVTVDLPDNRSFSWPDGKVGWSYTGLEPAVGTYQASTGPVLTDFSVNTAWTDAFDMWASPDGFGTCVGVFFLNCVPPVIFAVPPPCAGFYIEVWEDDGSRPATSAPITHSSNPTRFFEVHGANIGRQWTTLVDLDFAGKNQTLSVVRLFTGAPIPGGIAPGFLDFGTRLLCGPPALGSNDVQGISLPSTSTLHAFSVPADLSLVGVDLCAQAFGVAIGPFTVEAFNGLAITVGSSTSP